MPKCTRSLRTALLWGSKPGVFTLRFVDVASVADGIPTPLVNVARHVVRGNRADSGIIANPGRTICGSKLLSFAIKASANSLPLARYQWAVVGRLLPANSAYATASYQLTPFTGKSPLPPDRCRIAKRPVQGGPGHLGIPPWPAQHGKPQGSAMQRTLGTWV